MKLGGLALRVPRLPLRAPSGRSNMLLYVVYTLVLFLIFMVANFPHHVLVRRALDVVNAGPIELDVQATRFAWWKGYELRGVSLSQAGGADAAPLFASRSLFVRPGLAGLLRGRISSVSVTGNAYDGDIDGRWSRTGKQERITIHFDELELGRYGLLASLFDEGGVGGRLSGVMSFEPSGEGIAAGKAAGELAIADGGMASARVRGLIIPDLGGCAGGAKFSMADHRVEIQEFHLDCQELELSGSGQIIPQPRLADSRLNLRLGTKPGPAPSDGWKVLAALVPKVISGTVSHPRYKSARGREARR